MDKPTTRLADFFKQRAERDDAVAYLHNIKREALVNKRACGQARNPFKAVAGMEKDFEEAALTIKRVDRILKEIDRAPARAKRRKAVFGFADATVDRVFDVLIVLGLFSLTAVGLAALCIVLHINIFVLVGGVAAVAIIGEAWSRRKPKS